MMTTKNDHYNHSSEIGLAGDITQACLATAAKLLKEAKYRVSSRTNGQTRPGASLSRKRSKSDIDRKNNDDGQYLGDDDRDESNHAKRPGVMPDSHEKLSAGRVSAETELFDSSSFSDIVGQLRLWADGLDVNEGRLDKALEQSTVVKTALFTVFISMTTLLTKACRDIFHDEESALSLQSLTEKASIISPSELFDIESDDGEAGDKKETLDFETLVEEFSDLSQDLLELTPSLMDLEESRQLPEKGEKSNPVILQTEFQPELPHDHFKRVILDKYPDAQPALVECLAKECWNLYTSIKDGLIKRENAVKALAPEDKDSAYESMLQSELAPSLIGKLPTQPDQEWDEVSETTSLAEDSVQLKDRPKTPRPPVDLGPNIDFVCSICSRLQKGISNTRAWRKHVFADIRPYICSFDNCRQSIVRFATRSAWMQHEYDYHRQHLEWRCMYRTCPADAVIFLSEDDFCAHMVDHHRGSLSEDSVLLLIAKTCRRVVASRPDANIDCPVCLLSIPNKRSKIGRHLGRHMEDIALPIISLVVPTDEDTDASDKSDGETTSDNEDRPPYPIVATLPPTISPEMTPRPSPERTPSPAREILSDGAHKRRKSKILASQGNRELINHLASICPEGAEDGGLDPVNSSLEAEDAPVGTPGGIHKVDSDDPFWNPTSTSIDPFLASDQDIRWPLEIQAEYEQFLDDERIYVTEGVWDGFPPDSRLFVGNLSTEKVTKRDLFHVFRKHGKLAQISIKQAYGFVQFLEAVSCYQALIAEQGEIIHGRKISRFLTLGSTFATLKR